MPLKFIYASYHKVSKTWVYIITDNIKYAFVVSRA